MRRICEHRIGDPGMGIVTQPLPEIEELAERWIAECHTVTWAVVEIVVRHEVVIGPCSTKEIALSPVNDIVLEVEGLTGNRIDTHKLIVLTEREDVIYDRIKLRVMANEAAVLSS